MDTTLTAADVKDYILRGAQEPRLNPTTGQMEPPDPVQGAPETVYQLDAYGALSLLSRERAGTPICGYPVWTDGANLMLERTPGNPTPLPVPGHMELRDPSVAQGGRLIAVRNEESGSFEVLVLNQRAEVISTVPGLLARRYLERHTADLRWAIRTMSNVEDSLLLTLRRHDGTVEPERNLFREVQPTVFRVLPRAVDVQPLGDWAVIEYATQLALGECGTVIVGRWDLVPLGGGTAETVHQVLSDPCNPPPSCTVDCALTGWDGVAWAHDNRRMVMTLPSIDLSSGEVSGQRTFAWNVMLPDGTQPTVPAADPIQNWLLIHPRFTADDSVLVANETQLDEAGLPAACRVGYRRSTALITLLSDQNPAPIPQHCDPFDQGPEIFNLRVALDGG